MTQDRNPCESSRQGTHFRHLSIVEATPANTEQVPQVPGFRGFGFRLGA